MFKEITGFSECGVDGFVDQLRNDNEYGFKMKQIINEKVIN